MYAYTNILFTSSRPCRIRSASDQSPATSDLSFVAPKGRRMDYFRPKSLMGKPTKSAVDDGTQLPQKPRFEDSSCRVHLTGRNKICVNLRNLWLCGKIGRWFKSTIDNFLIRYPLLKVSPKCYKIHQNDTIFHNLAHIFRIFSHFFALFPAPTIVKFYPS